ncbi:mannitol-1-phosphate 5-dehydrogenase [Sporosarcina psychrophila]|uniref:mannitol-1-phosphate 5-dehydrogenase n=1 Tax=Sporosarcina psychrophila TaxID=1476 RepID=UPI00078E2A08|nr:mannitol-1-phosphate 5-dehydrogenase [Sporosarcina psychrophila]AMQ06259.1 mannitol-1-phosphate 5-dehydrogenase [Sporosarcina psychrophila]
MIAVHFGAGNIGRGFIGNLLYQSGFETCFVDVNSELVNLINEKKQYRVELANEAHEGLLVKNVRAINSATNPELVIETIAKADLVTAAVGPNVLPFIAGLLADGLKERLIQTGQPLTIIACENMIGGSAFLKEKVYEKLTEDEKSQFDNCFSFPNAAVDRIVPNQINEDKTAVQVEPFYEWVVEESEIIGENPPVKGITFVKDLEPYIERKLYTVNTGHAAVAYFGYLAGIRRMDEALASEEIKTMTENVLQETGKLLIAKYQFNEQEHGDYIQKIMGRFANPFISDDVTRVGRSPLRKLKFNDRLVGPATQYVELFDETPTFLAMGIAAALRYDYLEDPEAKLIQETIQRQGVRHAIEAFTGLKAGTALFTAIEEGYQKLEGN